MQKKIIALAIAGLASTAAFAQTNVTVYGVADLGQSFVSVKGAGTSDASVARLDSNSSLIGFKGVEDLGNGLKAVFQFESGIAADTNVGGLAGGRDSFVGLAGGFGTVVMGNLTHPLRAFGAKAELAPGASGFGTTFSVTGTILGLQTGADNRAQNAVAYVSPTFGGFSATAAYVNGETRAVTAGSVTQQRAWQLAGQYDNGPLFVGLGYHKAQDIGTTGAALTVPSATDDASIARLVAVYTLPSATKLTALVDRTKVGMSTATTDAKRTAFSLGVAQSFGKNTVGLEYARSGNTKVGGVELADTNSTVATLLYSYDLSKRTMLHARASRLNNDAGINTNFYVNPVANGLTTAAGADYTGFMVGLRHTF